MLIHEHINAFSTDTFDNIAKGAHLEILFNKIVRNDIPLFSQKEFISCFIQKETMS